MPKEMTVGDDYTAPCPHCGKIMSVINLTKAEKLIPGCVDKCNKCGLSFQVVKIDLIPVVYYKKADNEATEAV